MKHSEMNHGDMNQGHKDMCSMNMLFTWNYENTCVVFKWWHIRTVPQLVFSMIVIILISHLYEYLKYYAGRSVATGGSGNGRSAKISRASWYGLQVGFSFMLMLVFMTYNGWLMLAVVMGAAWGNYSWGNSTVDNGGTRSLACH
ncbi:LAFA_0E03840g1_1 [Lachancea sp. 'fantastica']|nr:LAFA_0E03840g1_1 [Lachancea sp. 'fantastica']